MKKPTDILSPIKTRGDFRQAIGSGQKQQSERESARERLLPLWAALADAYGNAFTNQFGDEPNDTWVDGLSQFDGQQVVDAVGRLITRGETYAPNLATVMGEIQQAKAPNQHLMYRSAQEALSAPIIDKGENRLLENNPVEQGLTPEDYLKQMREGL